MKMLCCPACGNAFTPGVFDKRNATFRCRLRIFDIAQEEAIADTDPEIVQTDDGTIELRGFPEIAQYIVDTTHSFHAEHDSGAPLLGMTADNVRVKLQNIRSTISRHRGTPKDGSATFRLAYDSQATFTEQPDHVPQYLVRLDMARIASPKAPS